MPQTLGVYDVYGTLGKGSFSRIRFAVNRTTSLSYAIKMFDKSKLRENGLLDSTRNEIAVMKSLDHKNCVGIRDMFASREKIYLVLDLMMGGSLRQKLNKRGQFREERARRYVQTLINVMEYCHSVNVIIGGLTLEGILVDSDGSLKLSDFGCSILETSAAQKSTKVATCDSHYMAPEMVEHNTPASRDSDVWSLGVVTYTLIAGYMPFELNPTLPEMLRNIRTASYAPYPSHFGEQLKDLLSRIFVADPSQRIKLPAIIEHDWCEWDREAHFDGNATGEGGEQTEDDVSDDDDYVGGNGGGPNPINNINSSSTDFFGEDNMCGVAFKSLPFVGITELFMAPVRLFQSTAGAGPAASADGDATSKVKTDKGKSREEKMKQQYVARDAAKAGGGSGAGAKGDGEDDSSDDDADTGVGIGGGGSVSVTA